MRKVAPPLAPAASDLVAGHIDKSRLTIAEPKRLRDKEHLKFVTSQPCLVCGRQPSDSHHLRFAQLTALAMKVSDEFLRCPCAVAITGNYIKPAMRWPGGRISISMRSRSPRDFGTNAPKICGCGDTSTQ